MTAGIHAIILTTADYHCHFLFATAISSFKWILELIRAQVQD